MLVLTIVHLVEQNDQLSEQHIDDHSSREVVKRSQKHFEVSSRHQIVVHQVQKRCVNRQPVLIVSARVVQHCFAHFSVNAVKRMEPLVALVDHEEPKTAETVDVEKQEERGISQFESLNK